MEAITAFLFSIFLCALFNVFFFPLSKLLLWLHSCLLSAISSPPNSHPKPASDADNMEKKKELDLETVFATFDSDGDGFISKGDLAESFGRLGVDVTGDDVRSMMERADPNADGLIDIKEFRELCSSCITDNCSGGDEADRGEGGVAAEGESELREAFTVFDGNGDGMITVEELRLVLKSLGLNQGDGTEACRDMIKKVDLDRDGMVNFEEFKRMMAVKGGNPF